MSIKLTTEDFIKRSKQVHGEKFNYDLVKYKDSTKKVIIICQEHGHFEQLPSAHLRGFGCKKDSGNINGGRRHLNVDEFIERARVLHGNFYNYSKVEYKSSAEKVTIMCHTHGEFEQRAQNHLQGQGCPTCRG